MKKAVGYTRVSSKEQREEGYSLPAQRKLLEEYAAREDFAVVGWFEEAETAKKAGRSQFGQMLKFLKKHKDVRAILVEKTDRLYRNISDWSTVDDLKCDLHFVKDGQVIGPNSRSNDKFLHGIKVLMAKNYSENLSEETRKGMTEKASQGLWPSFAPLGYINSKEMGGIDVDFPRAHVIRTLFEEYATGRLSIKGAVEMAERSGLRTRKGNRIAASAMAKLLQNPVYTGTFDWDGKRYQGKHQPLIAFSLWEKVQEVMHSKGRPRPKTKFFAFRGLLRCGTCGCMITAEQKKGQYVYYRCTRSRGKCAEPAIREDRLAELLGAPLKRLQVTEERVGWIVEALKASHADQMAYQANATRELEKEKAELQRKMDALYEDKLAGVVTVSFWERKQAEYQRQQDRIMGMLSEHTYAGREYLATGVRVLELANRAYALYLCQENKERRKLIDLIASNCILKDGVPHVELKEVFAVLADGAAKEAEMEAAGASKSEIEKEWLPG